MPVREVSAEELLGGKAIVAPLSAYPGLAKKLRERQKQEDADDQTKRPPRS